MLEATKRHVERVEDVPRKHGLHGIPENMFKGISHEMMQNIQEGKSPLCAIEKRIANGKMMAFNIGKAFGLIPDNSMQSEYLQDDHRFWGEQYFAQMNAGHHHHQSPDQGTTDFAQFDWSTLNC